MQLLLTSHWTRYLARYWPSYSHSYWPSYWYWLNLLTQLFDPPPFDQAVDKDWLSCWPSHGPRYFDPAINPAFDPAVDPVMDPTIYQAIDQTIGQAIDPGIDPPSDPNIGLATDPAFDPAIDPTINPHMGPVVYPPTLLYKPSTPSLCRIHTQRDLWRTKRSPRRPILPTLGACSACAWDSPWVSLNHRDWTRPTNQCGCQHDWIAQIPLRIKSVFVCSRCHLDCTVIFFYNSFSCRNLVPLSLWSLLSTLQ